MPTTTTCGICGAAAELKAGYHHGYVEGSTFAVYHCSSCAAAFARPEVATDSIYERIYEQADRVPGYSRYSGYAREILRQADPLAFLAAQEEAYWAVARVLTSGQAGRGRPLQVLDAGCGMGYLTHALARAGYAATGCDASARAIAHARQSFTGRFEVEDVSSLARLRPASFDVVLLVEVIEHAFDPATLAHNALAMVRPGGRLVITTPNRSLYPARTLWETELPPVHYWWLTEDAVGVLAKAAGCRMEILDFADYYRAHPCAVSIRRRRGSPFGQPVLAADGRVRHPAAGAVAVRQEGPLRALLRRSGLLPIVRPLLDRARGRRRCGTRGVVLCATLTRDT